MKTKSIKVILIVLIIIGIVVGSFLNISTASDEKPSVEGLVDISKINDFWDGNDFWKLKSQDYWKSNKADNINSNSSLDQTMKAMVGKKVTRAQSFSLEGAYCVDSHTWLEKYNLVDSTIVNAIDIDTGRSDEPIKVEGMKPGGTKYSKALKLSDSDVEGLLILTYLANMANKNNEGVVPDDEGMFQSYKATMASVFLKSNYVDNLIKCGAFSEYLKPGEYYGYSENVWLKLQEAIDNISKIKNMNAGSLEDKTEESNLKILSNNNQYYMGPYKLKLDGISVESLTVNDKKITEVYDSSFNSIKVKNIVNNKGFYIKVDNLGEQFNDHSIKVVSSSYDTLKARFIMIRGGSGAQNFAVYRTTTGTDKVTKYLKYPKYTNIIIKKEDSIFGNEKDLSGIKLKVYDVTRNKWLDQDSNGNAKLVDGFIDAKEFTIGRFKDSNNNVYNRATEEIKNLPLGKYRVYETYISSALEEVYGKLTRIDLPKLTSAPARLLKEKITNNTDIEVLSGTKEIIVLNNPLSQLYIKKFDDETGETLKGIQFKVYYRGSAGNGWIKIDNNYNYLETTEKFSEASVLETEDSGKTKNIKQLPYGVYELYEVGLGDYADMYELDEYISTLYNNNPAPGKGQEIYLLENDKFKKSENANLVRTIALSKPKRKEDLVIGVGVNNKMTYIDLSGYVWKDDNGSEENELDSGDYRFKNLEVRLMEKGNKNPIMTTKTDKTGYYKFEKVSKSQLDKYYIEITYDGMTYESVEIDKSKTLGSKAEENADQRTSMNNAFSEITGEGQNVNYNDKTIELSYNKDSNTDEVGLNNIGKTTEDEDKQNIEVSEFGDFECRSNTEYSTSSSYLKDAYDALVRSKSSTKEISNINFGLRLRKKADLELKKDVQEVNMTLNGQSLKYTFGKGASKETDNNKYRIPVYREDAEASNDKSMEITYKISLVNKSSLNAKVNSINEYFSKDLSIEKIQLGNEENARIIGSENWKEEVSTNGYTKYTITNINAQIEAGKEQDLYITLKVDSNKICENGKVNTTEFKNYAEIASYTIFKDNFKEPYAGFDKDSIPNGLIPQDKKTYEDDNDNVGIALKELTRKASGMVFIDNALIENDKNDTQTGRERIGNGHWDEGEVGVENVETQLLKIVDGKEVQYGSSVKTASNGNYEISSLLPGTYKVKFTWGEGTEKETKYEKNGIENKVTVDKYKSTIWVKDSQHPENSNFNKSTTRYSDALDNYEMRKAIDQNKSVSDKAEVDNGLLNILREEEASKGTAVMEAYTYEFNVPFPESGEGIIENVNNPVNIESYEVKNIDFGLVERPRQSMTIDKKVGSIEIKTDQNQIFAKYNVNPESNKIEKTEYVTGGPEYGWIKIETDPEILNSGTVANVEYRIVVNNKSEKDYDSERYYKYGEKDESKIIKLKPEGIYDYIYGISSDIDKNKGIWDSSTDRESSSISSKISEQLMSSVSSNNSYECYTDEFGNEVIKIIEEKAGEESKKIIEEYSIEYDGYKQENKNALKEALSGFSMTKYNEEKIEELGPGESSDAMKYFATTYLSSENKLTFDNVVEIRDAKRTSITGRSIKLEESRFFDPSEKIYITPATGENKNYTPLIMAIVSAVIILGVGIVLIKRIVLSM